MTPPSTSQMAPVTQLAWEESRKVTVEAMSRAAPMRPRGWTASTCQAGCRTAVP